MDAPEKNFLETCLFFNINTFSRHMVKLAEAEFSDLKLSPAHATLLLLVLETPGINAKDLSRLLHLNPSTVTRFIDALVKKKWLKRQNKGKQTHIFPTAQSVAKSTQVAQAYKNLYLKYSQIIGQEQAIMLSHQISQANDKVITHLDTKQP